MKRADVGLIGWNREFDEKSQKVLNSLNVRKYYSPYQVLANLESELEDGNEPMFFMIGEEGIYKDSLFEYLNSKLKNRQLPNFIDSIIPPSRILRLNNEKVVTSIYANYWIEIPKNIDSADRLILNHLGNIKNYLNYLEEEPESKYA